MVTIYPISPRIDYWICSLKKDLDKEVRVTDLVSLDTPRDIKNILGNEKFLTHHPPVGNWFRNIKSTAWKNIRDIHFPNPKVISEWTFTDSRRV